MLFMSHIAEDMTDSPTFSGYFNLNEPYEHNMLILIL